MYGVLVHQVRKQASLTKTVTYSTNSNSNSNTIGQSDDDVVTYGLLVHQVRKQATKTVTKIIFKKHKRKINEMVVVVIE